MTQPRFDVLAIGNAIVDVLSHEDDSFIASQALNKGGMTLIDAERAEQLYDDMGPATAISGGSAANTLAGLAQLGAKCAFIGQVAPDQFGQVFAHDIRAVGVHFDTPVREQPEPPTARCLIIVTADGQRTMNTFLGASQFLPAASLDPELIADSAILYLEGYLWDPEEPRAAMKAAIGHAKAAGRKVAFTLSAVFVIERHRAAFQAMIDDGTIDILFANEEEIQALTGLDDFEKAVAAVAPKVPVLVVTRSERGAIALVDGARYECAAEPVADVVDTTGAGDLFAAGYLAGHIRGSDPETCLVMGAVAAAEIISHLGPRSVADLGVLVDKRLAHV